MTLFDSKLHETFGYVHRTSTGDAAPKFRTIGIGIGIYLGCFLPGGNSAHNTIIITKSRYSHQKITHSKDTIQKLHAYARNFQIISRVERHPMVEKNFM